MNITAIINQTLASLIPQMIESAITTQVQPAINDAVKQALNPVKAIPAKASSKVKVVSESKQAVEPKAKAKAKAKTKTKTRKAKRKAKVTTYSVGARVYMVELRDNVTRAHRYCRITLVAGRISKSDKSMFAGFKAQKGSKGQAIFLATREQYAVFASKVELVTR